MEYDGIKLIGKILVVLLISLTPILGEQGNAYSQSFPVQVVPQATPPPPIYISEYADASTVNSPLKVQLILNDFQIANREVRLRAYFEGNGINFRTNDIVVGAQPLFLEGGVPLVLTNVDLAPYFKFENITGISPHQYGRAIPEGAYQFCFEVYDLLTGNRLSQKSCAVSVIFQNEPPFLVSPSNGINVTETNPQNIIFQWTPRSINVTNVEYELSLVEIWDNVIDPQAAFLSSPPVFQTITPGTTYIYGPGDPLLLPGKRYAWQVKAIAKQGAEEIGLFKNQGHSEIFSFAYAENCALPIGLNHEVKGSTNTNIFWEDLSNEVPEYTVRYRQKGKSNAWFFSKTTTNQLTLWDLKAGTTYEYQLRKKCAVTTSEWSMAKQFTTFIVDNQASVYECGIVPNFNLSNKEPLPNITSGEQFTAGDFPIILTKVNGENGRFTGEGYVTIPYLNSIKVAVEFTNVLINTDKQLAEGMVVTKYDSERKNILDVDVAIETIDTVSDLVAEPFEGDNDLDEMRVNFAIHKDSLDKYIKIKDGMVTITNPVNDASISEPLGDDKVVVDGDGQVYHIDASGKISEGGQIDKGGAVSANNVEGISKNGQLERLTAKDIQITFREVPEAYGFDQIPDGVIDHLNIRKEYPTIKDAEGKDYILVHQAVENQKVTYIDAIIKQSGNAPYPLDSIVFKTPQGEKITRTERDKDTLRLSLKGHYSFEHQTIYAVVPSKTDSTKHLTAGAFILWHLTDRAVDVVLVSVNGANIPENVSTDIKDIFKKGVASVNVSIHSENLTLDPSLLGKNQKLDIGESPWLANYNREQKEILSHLKNQFDYNNSTYYIFVFGNDVQPSKPIAGFMPLQRQYGFVFNNSLDAEEEGKKDLATTIAHEIGHGVFALRHPFVQYGKEIEGKTKWLMDYKEGALLSHMDWKQMQNPQLKFYVFQDDEEGEIAKKTWFTPNWEPFIVEHTNTIIAIPLGSKFQGAVPGFQTKDGRKFEAKFIDGVFENYRDSNQIIYNINTVKPEYGSRVFFFEYGGCYNNKRHEYTYSNYLKTFSDYKEKGSLKSTKVYDCSELCDEGQKFYDTYISSVKSEVATESFNELIKLICENGPDYYNALLSQINKLNQEEENSLVWRNYKYIYDSLAESFWAQENAWQKYASTLVEIKQLFEVNTNLKNVNTTDLFFIIGYASNDLLSTLSVKEKVEILQYLLTNEIFITEGNWLNIFSTTPNEEGLILKLISSVKSNESAEFLTQIQNYTVGDKTVFVKLFSMIQNVPGSEQFTALNQLLFIKRIEAEGGLENYITNYKDLDKTFKWHHKEELWQALQANLNYRSKIENSGKINFQANFKLNKFGGSLIISIDCKTEDCDNIWPTVDNGGNGIYVFQDFVPFTELNPYDIVLVEFTSAIEELNISEGTLMPIPAFFFHTIIKNNDWAILKKNLSDIITLSTIFLASVKLIQGAQSIDKSLAVSTLFFNASNSYVMTKNVRDWMEADDYGRIFLNGYKLINTVENLRGTLNYANKTHESIVNFMSMYLDANREYYEVFGKPFSKSFPEEYKKLMLELNKLR
ncbi:MAG: fibronectin type III domain-containing protein [Arenibacter sp.]|nr:fibronectin type III domain-containing protein [Arenibacter sp.]